MKNLWKWLIITLPVTAILYWVFIFEITHLGWELLDKKTLQALSAEQGRKVTKGAAKWKGATIEKIDLRGPDWKETRYPDGRIESK